MGDTGGGACLGGWHRRPPGHAVFLARADETAPPGAPHTSCSESFGWSCRGAPLPSRFRAAWRPRKRARAVKSRTRRFAPASDDLSWPVWKSPYWVAVYAARVLAAAARAAASSSPLAMSASAQALLEAVTKALPSA